MICSRPAEKLTAGVLLALLVCIPATAAVPGKATPSPTLPINALNALSPPPAMQLKLDEIKRLLANDELLEADVAAKQLVEQILEEFPADRPLAARALGQLALVQRLSGDYTAARQNYDAAIDLISLASDRLSPLLIEPLGGLAATQRASGDPLAAMEAYEQALHVSHVNYGPHSLTQADLLNEMLETSIAANDDDAAFSILNRLQRLYERNYSTRSAELVPVLRRRAELLKSKGRFFEERMTHRDIVTILIDSGGDDNPALIDTYQSLADTYLNEVNGAVFRSEPTTENGETWLRRALEIAEKRATESPQILLERLLALGDYYMLLDVQDKARSAYRRAAELLASDEPALAEYSDRLSQPFLLGRPVMSAYADFAYGWKLDDFEPEEFLNGHVTARYTISRRGRVTDITIVDANPAGYEPMETRVVRSLRDFLYRPRYRQGRPVASKDQSFRHEFAYRPDDLL